MEITTTEMEDVKVLAIQGHLDTNTSPDAESAISALIDSSAQKLLINFEELEYISSAGLRVLLATAKKLKASGGDLKICCLNETVQEVFDISGFSTILAVSASAALARRYARGFREKVSDSKTGTQTTGCLGSFSKAAIIASMTRGDS